MGGIIRSKRRIYTCTVECACVALMKRPDMVPQGNDNRAILSFFLPSEIAAAKIKTYFFCKKEEEKVFSFFSPLDGPVQHNNKRRRKGARESKNQKKK